ncbi:MAG: 16S rRNA (guanine(527)-N(7))-methyltransferase RsmG [Devosia nanyangense]|uniref:Ribosomal RNA small subunit methyltransferase G n=1 Tax=Devosia nanyangense TaxID=1228055 RepID=A0A933NWS0_9HYPH|nr:16S rRNA (guanine(527)-N(7))-methyltransferase RsmG [Devosia nanyangense]
MSVESDLEAYGALLRKWNAVQNLVSRETLGHELRSRHIRDSLQLMSWIRPSDRYVLDLGSGGGFPAIPLAIASRGVERRFTLLEPSVKKASFLRTVARELHLPVSVETVRAEQFDSRETPDLITSRALAALPVLLGYAVRFCGPNSHMLLHKGREYRRELDEAAQLFDFDVLVHESETDSEGVVLEIDNLHAKSVA